MESIYILDEERMQNIPDKYWQKHEFCFFLHDQLVSMLIEYEKSDVHKLVLTGYNEAIKEYENEFGDLDIIAFLKDSNLIGPYKHLIRSHVIISLTADMLHFLYEALRCFEKRKFCVGFTLLRKPLKEHLLFLSWLLADEDDFINRFEANNFESLNNPKKERIIEIFSGSIEHIAIGQLFESRLLWDMIYSKKHPNGFEPTFQRATHLITSMGDLLKTEDYSINLIFENHDNDNYYEFIYSKLPYLFIYIVQVALELFNHIKSINRLTYSHLVLITAGCYEVLFLDGRSQCISKELNRSLYEFLNCIHCDSKLRITKKKGFSFYLTEHMRCNKCGTLSQFPLYWIMGKTKVNIYPKKRDSEENTNRHKQA